MVKPSPTPESSRILVADPDVDSVAEMTYALAKEGHRVLTAGGGMDVLSGVRRERPDLAVLECALPDMSGVNVARRLRDETATDQIGIVLLATDPTPELRVSGLRTGADDFLAKPFAPDELILRVRNVLSRRIRNGKSAPSELVVGPLAIDRANPWVSVDGRKVSLTPTEYRLILALADRVGVVMSRSELLERVWRVTGREPSRTVDIHVRRLRAKLGSCGDRIESVRGFGYRLRES